MVQVRSQNYYFSCLPFNQILAKSSYGSYITKLTKWTLPKPCHAPAEGAHTCIFYSNCFFFQPLTRDSKSYNKRHKAKCTWRSWQRYMCIASLVNSCMNVLYIHGIFFWFQLTSHWLTPLIAKWWTDWHYYAAQLHQQPECPH